MTSTVRVFQLFEHRTTVLMPDCPLELQLAFTGAQSCIQLTLQVAQVLNLCLHLRDFALKHCVHLIASMVSSPQRQKFLDLAQGKPQLLCVTDELEVMNMLVIKDAIPTGAPRTALDQAYLLVKPDCVHTDASQPSGIPDEDRLCHS